MKRFAPRLTMLLTILGAVMVLSVLDQLHAAWADGNVAPNGSTPVAIVATQAGTTCVESTVAAGNQPIVTVTGVSGQYFYITNISWVLNAIAAPAATLLPVTTTNVPGSYSIRQAVQAAVGTQIYQESFPTPLKTSSPGTNTVFTGTLLANVSMSGRVCGFFAP